MKILLIDGAPHFGGQARHVYDLALGLRDRGHEVAASCNHEKLYAALESAEIPVVRARYRRAPDVPTILTLHRAITSMGIDVVHTHGVRAGVTGRLAAKLAGCRRIVHTVHTMSDDLVQSRGPLGAVSRIAYAHADHLMARWTDIVIAISNDIRHRTIAEGVPRDKVITVYSGIDLSRCDKLDKVTARKKLGIPNGCRVVGTAARLNKQKNLGDLLRAGRTVMKQFSDVVLAIIGDGEEMPALRRLAQDLGIGHKVLFIGYRSDVPEVLPAFDVFAMSSLWEGCPLGALEAMAAGLPVVAPDIPGISETVVDQVTGCIVPKQDPDALADGICRILSSGQSAEMGAAARESAASHFGLDKMVEQVERTYIGRRYSSRSRVVAPASR